MKSKLAVNATLLLIAFIWGVGFVPQRLGMEYAGPYAFNALRFFFGALTLLPVLMLRGLASNKDMSNVSTIGSGFLLGLLLLGGATFQQISIQFTTLANVAFITGLYAIIIPVIGFFVGYRYSGIVWFGGIIAIIGLYLMTGVGGQLSIKGDLFALIGAIFWAVHILVLVYMVVKHNQLILAFYQFLFCAILSAGMSLGYESHLLPDEAMGYIWALLNGVIVVGIAYTLQLIVLEYAEPFVAAIVFSLEAVFGAVAGYLVFAEKISLIGFFGAVLMLVGCVLAQVPDSKNNQLENS